MFVDVLPKTELCGGGVLRRVLMWSPIVSSDRGSKARQGNLGVLASV